ncbi:hypothetical protein [Plantactinospora sp. CA-290183]|uniref:hypothetical protein n=1 Tax=Plantactinospora sp. CA-290183 TaxID=3240006 RepID=UPI003D901326
MRVLRIVRVVALLVAVVVAGCHALPTGPTPSPPPGTTPDRATAPAGAPPAAGAPGADVIDLNGLRNIEFGDTEQELRRRGVLHPEEARCGHSLTDPSTVSPVFDKDRLVLLWASPAVRTPEGVTAGTPVNQVRASYPAATRLTAPPGTYRFDGLLARDGDRAYLFLHDGRTVRKTVAGYADYARRLFDEGFGTC